MSSYAPDGGLWVPAHIPRLTLDDLRDLLGQPFPLVVATVLSKFAADEIPFQTLLDMAQEAYTAEQWGDEPDILPLHPLCSHNKRTSVLETFHGPTAAVSWGGAGDRGGAMCQGCPCRGDSCRDVSGPCLPRCKLSRCVRVSFPR